ncbi:MAG: enoyl-CoA hydratase/isomerase family protein, partial [Syntrophales bacterium]
MNSGNPKKPPVIMRKTSSGMSIILNRKDALNSLNLEMVRLITDYFDEALADDNCKLILFYGLGDKGFCAGGDIRRIAADMRNNNFDDVNKFFLEEFSLDLMIHRCPKPVIVIADGITMGGGLGIASGADWVIATEKTRMAMPETRIGFFPDVGATGWMFSKCPKGYPEYLGLTGYEMKGAESGYLGPANRLTTRAKLQDLKKAMKSYSSNLSTEKKKAVKQLEPYLAPFFEKV